MESKISNEIKEKFASHSTQNNFEYFASEPIVAPDNSKLLFNISGGVKFQDELLELKKCKLERVSSIQKCVRTDSLDKIGFSARHHLYFEMLGHFMFYANDEKETKEEFIRFAYTYLVNIIGLNKNRIFATVHPNDNITQNVWESLGNKNIIISDENTFVSPYADKSALRTEILWQINKDKTDLVELWNLVFTQYNSKNVFENPSSLIAADSGASLERITSAYENVENNYENSMWHEFVDSILNSNNKDINYFRRIADLTNTVINLINEGLMPGNKVQPYMLRKMLRMLFDICDDFRISVEDVIDYYYAYNKSFSNLSELKEVIIDEKIKYESTIQNGLRQAQKIIQKKGIENIDLAYLKSTCGLSEKYLKDMFENHTVLSKK